MSGWGYSRAFARVFGAYAWGVVALAACGRDVTAPAGASRGVFLAPVFPNSLQLMRDASASTSFTSVRAMLTSPLGAVVVDTTVVFPASADSIVLQLTVPISGSAVVDDEILIAQLWCINGAGVTVFKGGPVPVVPAIGSRVNATLIPLVYVGPGGGGDTTGVGGVVATALAIATQPVTSVAGTALALTVDVVDAAGNIVTSFTGPIAIALGANAGSATLGGTLTANAVNGVATFSNVLLTKAASAYTLVASASALSSATSHAFNINAAAPAAIAITGGNNQSGLLSALLGTPLSVIVHDTYGNVTPGIAVAWGVATGGGVLVSATTQTDANGIATNTWTLGSLLGLQTVTATAAGLSTAPVTFTATALKGTTSSTVSQLVMSVLQSSVTAGATLATIVVSAEDATGNLVSNFASAVQIALGSNPAGATLGGTTTANAVNGIAKFANIVMTKAAAGYTLVASGGGFTSSASSTFSVLPAAAASMVMSAIPATATAGSPIASSITVTARDAFGNIATGFNGPVQLALGSSPGGSTLGGTTTVNAVSGVATFSNAVLTKATSGYTLIASGDGLTSQASSMFTVVAGAPTVIMKEGGDNQSATLAALGALLSNPLSVLVADAYGNPVSGATVSWVVSAGNASLGSSTSTTNTNGVATNLLTLLGLLPGVDQVTASVAGATGSVVFAATGLL